jgi:GntR family transcriptional regulator
MTFIATNRHQFNLNMLSIDRTSPLPLHHQLKQHLLQKIESGEWKPDDLIPSEQELQEQFGLSRTTVRQALSDLVHEGLLLRERGRGTFVTPPKMTHNPSAHKGLTQFMEDQGITPGWQVLEKGFVTATKEVATSLKLPAKSRVYALHRLRLAEEKPIGVHIAFLPEGIAGQINEAGLQMGGSLHYLSHLPQMLTSRASRTIEAVAASEGDVALLQVGLGCPILQISRFILSSTGEPLEYLQARYRGDRFKYQIGE